MTHNFIYPSGRRNKHQHVPTCSNQMNFPQADAVQSAEPLSVFVYRSYVLHTKVQVSETCILYLCILYYTVLSSWVYKKKINQKGDLPQFVQMTRQGEAGPDPASCG